MITYTQKKWSLGEFGANSSKYFMDNLDVHATRSFNSARSYDIGSLKASWNSTQSYEESQYEDQFPTPWFDLVGVLDPVEVE